jgi:hypothetical protein
MENSEKFYKDGLNFTCAKCSFCCGHSPGFVYLSKRDLFALCEYKNLPVKSFVEKYCRWADYYYGTQVLALIEKNNYDCVLWENGCSCYPARPIQCSTYPFWTWMIKDKETWEQCAKECPGINKGECHSAREIEKASKLYSENQPLHKEDVFELIKAEENHG